MKERTPRGFLCLHAMIAQASSQVEYLISILKRSEIDKPALGILIDGSFGFSYHNLEKIIKSLNEDGRKFHLLLYLSNGVSLRKEQTKIPALGAGGNFEEFAFRISRIAHFRKRFIDRYQEILPLLRLNKNLGGHNVVCPMLEDSLDNDNFIIFQTSFRFGTPHDLGVQWARHPSFNIFPHAEKNIPQGIMKIGEAWKSDHRNGIITNFNHSFRIAQSSGTPLAAFSREQQKAYLRNNWFLLWGSKFQGDRLVSPFFRNYINPSRHECLELSKFLGR